MEGSATSQPGLKRNWKSVEIQIGTRKASESSDFMGKTSDWWFGTFFYFSMYWECHHPN